MAASPPDPPEMTANVRALAERGVVRHYRKGAVLIEEGDVGDTIYIVLAGRLRIYGTDVQSDREITHGVYGPGEYVGEMSLDGGPRAASVMALEPCTLSVVTRQTLQAFITERPDFAFELLAKVIRRARAATLSAKQLALNDVYGRLRTVLERLAEPGTDDTHRLPEKLTQLELAQRVGCTREMIGRVMKDLTQGRHVWLDELGHLQWRRLPQRW
jgi:CRP/FNR family cyclic AMP-dependent transcriptional regulator